MTPRDLLPVAAVVALFLGGFGAGWSWQGARADARISKINEKAEADRAALISEWGDRLIDEIELGNAIDRAAAARDRELTTRLQETRHALTTATTGRPCLGGAALRLLDHATGLRPPAANEAALALHRGAAAAPSDPEGEEEVATDTDVAGWIAVAGDYYERCRERIRDIRRYEEGR